MIDNYIIFSLSNNCLNIIVFKGFSSNCTTSAQLLAFTISSVFKEVCGPFRVKRKVEVVTVVGGMSEQKQRRLLCGGTSNRKPVHVLVATPGRLCELIQDGEIPMFADLSGLRFLIVDEADRIVEDGHFAEVR